MIHYLVVHLALSFAFAAVALPLARCKAVSNRLQLLVLYLLLAKSLLPWGLFSLPMNLLRRTGGTGDGISPDGFDAALVAAGTEAVLPRAETVIAALWAGIAVLILGLTLRNLVGLGRKIAAAPGPDDAAVNRIFSGLAAGLRLEGRVELKVSEAVSSPVVFWSGHWLVVLPNSVLALSEPDKETILAHELAHVQRKDFFRFLFLKAVRSVFFFSPFVWFATAEILGREEIETDGRALRSFRLDPVLFGRAILNFFETNAWESRPIPSLVGSTRRRMEMRLEGLFRKTITKNGKLGMVLVVAGLLALSFMNCSSVKGASRGDSTLADPVPGARVSMGFGTRPNPFTKRDYFHTGIDLAADGGTPVLAAEDGVVTKAEENDQLGNYVLLKHHDGIETFYAHMERNLVTPGRKVKRGEKIALVGSTGVSTGPHLHFEVRKNGKPADPRTMVDFD